jgi:hypothetical protein
MILPAIRDLIKRGQPILIIRDGIPRHSSITYISVQPLTVHLALSFQVEFINSVCGLFASRLFIVTNKVARVALHPSTYA